MYTEEEYFKAQIEYWRQVSESEGFDIEDVSIPPTMRGMITGLMPYDCNRYNDYPYSVLVNLYAQVGLRLYKLSTLPAEFEFEFGSLVKFNMLQNLVSSFYMTLLVRHPSTLEEREFQVRIDESIFGSLHIACPVARFKDGVRIKTHFIPHFQDGMEVSVLPDWPPATQPLHLSPSDMLVDQFRSLLPNLEPHVLKERYVLEGRRCQCPDFDWIYLYLRLAICAHDRRISNDVLNKLEIVHAVLIPDRQEPRIRNVLNRIHIPRRLDIFIVYKGLATARKFAEIGEDVERKAIVSQVINSRGYFSLRGKLL